MDQTPNLKLPYILPSQAQKHVTHNESLATLDAVVQLAVIGRNLAAPPASPADGDRHIVPAGATSAWAGHDNRIAVRQDGSWVFLTPVTGWRTWVANENTLLAWNGTDWVSLHTALQEVSLFGLNTATTDTNTPFAARLKNALWAALPLIDGGTGDVRQTMNKEAAGNVASLLLQSGWISRAEIGLTGDNDLHFKVSPNGSTFIEALRIDSTTGMMTHADGEVPRTLAVLNSGSTNSSASGSGTIHWHSLTKTLPPGFLTAGRTLRVTTHWRLTTGGTAISLDFKLAFASLELASISAGAVALNQVDRSFSHSFIVQAIQPPTGAAQVLWTVGSGANAPASAAMISTIAQPVSAATSGSLTLRCGTRWSAAGTGTNTVQLAQFLVEALN